MNAPRVKTVAVDFDGVIHAYRKGWQDGSIYDTPVPGAIDALWDLMDRCAVFVFTTRNTLDTAAWLRAHRLPCAVDTDPERTFWNGRGTLLVTNRKLAAVAYIDDRAVRFISWPTAFADLEEYTGITVSGTVTPERI